MKIRQINLTYNPSEDRVLMRVNTDDSAEYRFWLTRTIVIQLRSGLAQTDYQILESELASYSFSADEKSAYQNTQSSSELSTEYSVSTPSYPLGEIPLLVVKISMKTEGVNPVAMFDLMTNKTFSINMDKQMVSNLYLILRNVVKIADWNLSKHQVTMTGLRHMWVAERDTIH